MKNYRNFQLYHHLRSRLHRPPQSSAEALESKLYKAWWFYGAELFPGVIKPGIFPDTMPLPARMLLRNCRLKDADCLDIGSMEGLLPILMCKQGARSVLATDFNFHCYAKMAALMKCHQVDYQFKRIGLLYDLAKKISSPGRRGFDFINLSGVLYHVFSPLHVMAGLRPLLKKNGLMIVSTNVINRDDYSMEFNNSGKLQSEANTFWYLSIRMFDYMLRYFQLMPVDCIYYKYPDLDQVRHARGLEAGYLSVVCRAVNDRGAQFNDKWLAESITDAWEYLLCDQKMLESQSVSPIKYIGDQGSINLVERIRQTSPFEKAVHLHDTHLLKLNDRI